MRYVQSPAIGIQEIRDLAVQFSRAHEVHGISVGVLGPGSRSFDEADGYGADRQRAEDSKDHADASCTRWRDPTDAFVFDLDYDPGCGPVVPLKAAGYFREKRGARLLNIETAQRCWPVPSLPPAGTIPGMVGS